MQKVKKKNKQKNLSCFPLSLWTDPQPNEDHKYTPTQQVREPGQC